MGSTPGVLISVVNAKQKHNLKYHYESGHGVVIHVIIVKYTSVELENAHDNMVRVTTGTLLNGIYRVLLKIFVGSDWNI